MASRIVWIINPYGSLPSEGWATYRSTMLARALAARGHVVTQFLSNFEHRSKSFRDGSGVVHAEAGYTIELIDSTRYDAHVSLGRIRYERTFARNLLAAIGNRPRPDVVILAEPSLFYYGILLRPLLAEGSALVLDVIDVWPELFALVLPKVLRPWSRWCLAPLYWWRKRLFRRADAVVAVARDYADLARPLVRSRHVPIDVVYWSYDDRARASAGVPPQSVLDLVARKQPGEVWAVYAGTLGENYDIPAVIDLAQRLPAMLAPGVTLKVIVAGDGPLTERCRASAGGALVFLGRLEHRDLELVYRHSDIALSTYRGDSTVAMPIKAFDYLRYGLPVVNSLGRDLGRIVRDHHVGINYDPSDPSALAAAVERLSVDATLRREMAANARALAGSFSADRQYGRFADIVEEAAARRGSTVP